MPERYLRRYSNAICSGRQVVRFGEYLLPDTWRHPHQQTLGNRHLVTTSPYFGTYQKETRPTETRPLAGAFYYLDTELPGHFGHITTEVLSRVWAWRTAVAENPSVRLLMGANRLPATIPGYQRMILQALGMRVDDAVILGPRQAVEVETLYGPTPQLENPHHVDPDIAEVWAQLGAGLPDGKPATADKIFISRRPSDKRHCRQTPDVERFFATNGFEIVFPEDHPYQDQKAMFARARVIAGFGGSGLFNAMFASQARLIVISGDSYNAQNEHLIAAANGNELHYFWGKSEVPMPENRFSLPAFTSAFDFDLRRHKRALRRVIR